MSKFMCLLFIFVSFTPANNNLILNLPNTLDYAEESLNLTIHLPNKIEASKEVKELEKRQTIPKKIRFNSKAFDEISKKSRFKPIMRSFISKGVLQSSHDEKLVNSPRRPLIEIAARMVIRTYKALLVLEEKSALRAQRISPDDIMGVKELIDELQSQIRMFTYQPVEMQRDLDRILTTITKATGKGAITITGLKESDDGTTLNLEISRER